MKKNTPMLALAVCLLLPAGCGGPVNSFSFEPVPVATDDGWTGTTDDDLTGATDGLAGDGTMNYVMVKAAADEPVAAAQDIYYWGYINTKGEWVIAPKYTEAYPFVDNVATVKTESGEWQLINKSNEVIAKFEKGIEVIEPLHPTTYPPPMRLSSGCTIFDGMIIIARDANGDTIITEGKDLYGYADVAGKIVIEPKYQGAGAFQEGLAAVDFSQSKSRVDQNWGYIDQAGNTVIEPKFSWAGVFSEGLARAQSNEEPDRHSGFIDKKGHFVISSNNNVYPNGDFKNGTAPARIGSEFGIIDKSGNTVATVPGSKDARMYSDYSPIGADSFQGGLYPLMDVSLPNTEDGYWPQGFIDTEGNFAVPAQTEWKICQGFSDGMGCVFTGRYNAPIGNKYGYIDKTGKVVIPIQYCRANMFNFGYAAVATGDMADIHYAVIDKTGKTVIELNNVTDAKPFTR